MISVVLPFTPAPVGALTTAQAGPAEDRLAQQDLFLRMFRDAIQVLGADAQRMGTQVERTLALSNAVATMRPGVTDSADVTTAVREYEAIRAALGTGVIAPPLVVTLGAWVNDPSTHRPAGTTETFVQVRDRARAVLPAGDPLLAAIADWDVEIAKMRAIAARDGMATNVVTAAAGNNRIIVRDPATGRELPEASSGGGIMDLIPASVMAEVVRAVARLIDGWVRSIASYVRDKIEQRRALLPGARPGAPPVIPPPGAPSNGSGNGAPRNGSPPPPYIRRRNSRGDSGMAPAAVILFVLWIGSKIVSRR